MRPLACGKKLLARLRNGVLVKRVVKQGAWVPSSLRFDGVERWCRVEPDTGIDFCGQLHKRKVACVCVSYLPPHLFHHAFAPELACGAVWESTNCSGQSSVVRAPTDQEIHSILQARLRALSPAGGSAQVVM